MGRDGVGWCWMVRDLGDLGVELLWFLVGLDYELLARISAPRAPTPRECRTPTQLELQQTAEMGGAGGSVVGERSSCFETRKVSATVCVRRLQYRADSCG
mmetsp:Transcript_69521/g.154998  ORF Transcript_69521/g.154998 Transcript_69521/m.154998 type:complete len:100 (-) Transcript_69521:172-471(-)